MRVLIVSHGFPPYGIAGVERVAHQTATSLAARGHDVTVLTRRPTQAPPTLALERDRVDGVPVIRIAGGDSTFGLFPGREDLLERIFERVLAEATPDVVVFAHLLHQSAGDVAVAQRWGIPTVLELHDFYTACPLAHLQRVDGSRCGGPEGGRACAAHCFGHQEQAEARWSLRALEFGQALRDADAVLAPSRFVAEYFAEARDAGAARTPIYVLGNGVGLPGVGGPRPVRRAPQEPLRLASVGVVTGHKGIHTVIQALRLAEIGEIHYTLFGKVVEDYADALRALAARVPGLTLQFAGAFQPAELPRLLTGIDLALVPSIVWETYSIAAREAFACGIPVVASRLGALPEAVRDGENGRLFEAGDARDLAGILHGLDADRDALAALANGIADGDWMTVDDRTDAVEALLSEVVAAGARRSGPARELAALRAAF
ncbi:glycosyltransferase [Baekduia sp. Peel2402]|uniref:glycosyltransferase n=1 Tax=Baekduia sp. Peel2402 TaxID=3458296 RepID=UPI00403EB185